MIRHLNSYLTAIILVFASTVGSLLAQTEYSWPKEGMVIADKLTIRAKPGTHFESLGSFSRGDKVVAIGKYENWLEVKLPDSVLCWVTRLWRRSLCRKTSRAFCQPHRQRTLQD